MTASARRAILSMAVVAGIVGVRSTAHARTISVVPYAPIDVWPTAIRFLRVDNDYPIKEKDEPSGYVLFDLPENKRAYRAALEMVKATDTEGRAATQIICTIQELPRRYEASLLAKLTAKVRDERGPPPPPPARKAPAPSEPAGKDPRSEGKPDPRPPGDLSGLPGPPIWGPPPAP